MGNRIGLKLIGTIGAAVVVIVATFAVVILRGQRNALIAQVKLHADQISETIKSSTRHHMQLDQRESIRRIMDTLAKQEGIEKVRIFNKDGKIIFSSDKSEVGAMVNKRAEACYACHVEDEPLEKLDISERARIFKTDRPHRTLGIINPVYNERACWEAECHEHDADQEILGVLDVAIPLGAVDARLRRNRTEMVLLAVTIVASISLIGWLAIFQFVGRPVRKLLVATRHVAEGDLTYQTDIRSRDELGVLGKSFDGMMGRLSEAQQQVYQSQKLASLGRLTAGIAHEINNPLTGVLSFASILLKRLKDEEMKKDLEVVVRETKRCREIVKGLLDFSRQVPFVKTDVSLGEIVRQALKVVENQVVLKDVKVTIDVEPGLPSLWADANQLQQVFINLFINALDAVAPHTGTMTLRARLLGDGGEERVEAVLADNGCGISKENLSKIFDPFFSTKGQRGTGLGLAIVWGIVEKHGGTIRAESEEGKGTLFVLQFPVHKNAKGGAPA